MKKNFKPLLSILLTIIVIGIIYYVTLPAINIHSRFTWNLLLIIFGYLTIRSLNKTLKKYNMSMLLNSQDLKFLLKSSVSLKIFGGGFLALVIFLIIGTVLSMPLFNSKAYYNLMQVSKSTFAKDVSPANFDDIPLLDKDSAALLGDREMGSMVDMVSQFEIGNQYSQININGKPVRVSPLKYASVIKWMANMSKGIPAYVSINMSTQDAEIIKLKTGMKYTSFDHFNRLLTRRLRFKYPTYIFFDQLFFEIDDEGTPYYICPVKDFKIGLFGGVTVGKVVLVNALNGECKDYDVKDVPKWVDKVYSADLLTELYNYHGMLINGYLNSLLSQKGCLKATNGYNYIAKDDDVWVYTGVTSASADQAIVGFVLMNQRTAETKFYSVEGAIEDSARASAEGQVQNLHYTATFPLLLNVSNKPTYFMALKDSAGLVKKYALVSVEKYQLVAIGDTINQCKNAYTNLLQTNGIFVANEDDNVNKAQGKIKKLSQVVVDGNTHFYLQLENDKNYYDVNINNLELLSILNYDTGSEIKFNYVDDGKLKRIKEIILD